MPLTPIDVQQKTFATALRGYDLDEVDDFLDAVVVALKDYDQRLSDAQERISTLEAELNDKGDAEGAISRALVAAQRSADAIVADAKEEAQRILSDADNEANELADTRDAERRRLQTEIDELRSKVSSVRGSVAELAAAIPVTLDQNNFQNGEVALLDFEDATGNCEGTAETNTTVTGTVPTGTYSGVVFELGVPFDVNHDAFGRANQPVGRGLKVAGQGFRVGVD